MEDRKAVRARGGLMTRLAASRAGAVALEFALGVPIFIALVYGLFEFGRVFWSQNTLEYAIEEAARYAVVNTSATAAEVQAVVTDSAVGLKASDLTITVTFQNNTDGERSFVNITGTFAYAPLFPLRGLAAFDINTSTRMAVVQ